MRNSKFKLYPETLKTRTSKIVRFTMSYNHQYIISKFCIKTQGPAIHSKRLRIQHTYIYNKTTIYKELSIHGHICKSMALLQTAEGLQPC